MSTIPTDPHARAVLDRAAARLRIQVRLIDRLQERQASRYARDPGNADAWLDEQRADLLASSRELAELAAELDPALADLEALLPDPPVHGQLNPRRRRVGDAAAPTPA